VAYVVDEYICESTVHTHVLNVLWNWSFALKCLPQFHQEELLHYCVIKYSEEFNTMTAKCILLCLTTVTTSCAFAYRINAAHSADCPPTHTYTQVA